ncbi:hypothetical protein SOVF_009810, partial [Spinacia oleracea]
MAPHRPRNSTSPPQEFFSYLRGNHVWKSIGVSFKTPKDAIE